MEKARISRRGVVGAAAGAAVAGPAAAGPARLPKAVVTGADGAGRSKVAYVKQMRTEDLAAAATPLLAWDATPAAPNDGAYVAPLSERKTPWTFNELFPTGTGVRVLYSTIPPGRTYALHDTPSIDIVFVLSGRVVMGLDDGEVTLEAGDVVVQNATRHSWRTPAGGEPCVLGGVVLSAALGAAARAP